MTAARRTSVTGPERRYMVAQGRIRPRTTNTRLYTIRGSGRSNATPFGSRGMTAVRYADLSLAFDFVSDAWPMEHDAYVSLDTGKVYWTSDFDDAFDEDRPDDLETSDRYLAIPHKNEL